jgi:long-chain acyl-CoA synthetase
MKLDLSYSPLLTAIYNHSVEIPDKIALIEGDNMVTYSQLWRAIEHASKDLEKEGFKKGDRLILQASKELFFVYRYFACHLIGVIAVVVDPASTEERMSYIRDIIKQKGMIADDTADLMFTTGTTGAPKGVCLSHANIAGSAENINAFIGNTSEEVEVLGLPLSHSFGLGRLRCTLLKGATMVLVGNFANLKVFFNALEQYHATGFGMVPAVWQYIRKFSGTRISKFSSQIKYIEIGSASMPVEDKELLIQLFPNTRICMHYGLTEASRSFFMEFHSCKNNLSTIGVPASSLVQAKIIDENGVECKTGEDGEVCVKGNMVMHSYFLPEDNKNAFFGEYFRTGDWGHQDKDGLFYLTGRKKELINVGGKKISPALIEDAILSLGIADCACVSIPDPSGILGEVPKAFLVQGKSDFSIEDIKSKLSSILEPFEIPVSYEWIDNIPRTSSGKIQRLKLK